MFGEFFSAKLFIAKVAEDLYIGKKREKEEYCIKKETKKKYAEDED